MTKHRLELFSDGVFAIVLTLLVLDLRVPSAPGLAGLWEIVPALFVHAASFLVVASLWFAHHGVLARVTTINSRTLKLNLVCLFWITLIPFGAKNAAEHPLEAIGASLAAAATGFGILSLLYMRLSAHSTIDDNPRLERYRRRQVAAVFALGAVDVAGAAMALITPWPAYAATTATAIILLAMPSPAEVEQRAGAPTDGATSSGE